MEREWLEEQLATGRSLQAIAEAAGRSASTVAYWIDKHGLVASHASRHAAKGPVEEAVLRDLVERGASTRDIAAELGRSQASVRHWLARFGLRTALAVGRGGDKPATAVRRCDVHGEVAFRLYEGYRYRCPACVSAAVAEHRRQRKALLVAEAGGRCAVCGYSRYAGALQFHHLAPEHKAFAISLNGATRSLQRLRDEAEKCILLCGNCHAEVEAGITQLPFGAADVGGRSVGR